MGILILLFVAIVYADITDTKEFKDYVKNLEE